MNKMSFWSASILWLVVAVGLLPGAEQLSPGSGLRKQRKVTVKEAYAHIKGDICGTVDAFYDQACTKPVVNDDLWRTWHGSQATYPEWKSMIMRITIKHLGLPLPPPPASSPGRGGAISAAALTRLASLIKVKITWAYKGTGFSYVTQVNDSDLRIAPGEAEELLFNFNPQYFLDVYPPNPLHFDIQLDTANAIDEANEGNNRLTGQVRFVIK